MTTSLVLHPRWADSTLMYVYDQSPNHSNKVQGMESLGANYPPSHSRELLPHHPALGRHSGTLAHHHHHHHHHHQIPPPPPPLPPPPPPPPSSAVYSELPAIEPGRQCPATQGSPAAAAALGYAYPFGNAYYGCRLPHPHNVNLPQNGLKPCAYHPGEKYTEAAAPPGLASAALPGDELTARAKEYAFYPSFASSYPPVPSYLDVSVVPGIGAHGEPRHDALIPMEGYQHWALSNSWDGQIYCSKEQTQPSHLWKSPFPDVVPLQPEGSNYRRGRKKRVPYTKQQLKDLEREYSASKFITKEKRRRIASNTNLSERQVTIWFQNRRVKEKKIQGKPKSGHIHAT